MGLLVNGVWCEEDAQSQVANGRYVRSGSQFRQWVTADGSSGFPAAAGRYHLYIAIGCPWAHRYLGRERGDQYIATTGGIEAREENILVCVHPQRWLAADYGKELQI